MKRPSLALFLLCVSVCASESGSNSRLLALRDSLRIDLHALMTCRREVGSFQTDQLNPETGTYRNEVFYQEADILYSTADELIDALDYVDNLLKIYVAIKNPTDKDTIAIIMDDILEHDILWEMKWNLRSFRTFEQIIQSSFIRDKYWFLIRKMEKYQTKLEDFRFSSNK